MLHSATRESASTRVFYTIELLTMILKFCPLESLLCVLPRINKTFKSIIDTNKNIQHYLCFQPWGDDDYWLRYAKINHFLPLLSYISTDAPSTPGCFYDFGPGPDGDSDDEGWLGGDFREDDNLRVFHELHWRKLEQDERFMRPEASWRRMMPVQPQAREIWNYDREKGKEVDGECSRELDPRGKGYPRRLGELYEDAKALEADNCCLRTRTLIRSSERYHLAVQVNVEVKPIDSEEDIQNKLASVLF